MVLKFFAPILVNFYFVLQTRYDELGVFLEILELFH